LSWTRSLGCIWDPNEAVKVKNESIHAPIAFILIKICPQLVKNRTLQLEELSAGERCTALYEVQDEPFLVLARDY
jgi:hypothetical protein